MAEHEIQRNRDAGLRALTAERQQALVEAVRTGVPVEAACEVIGIATSTLREWLAIGDGRQPTWHNGVPVSQAAKVQCEALSAALTQARAEREATLVQAIAGAVGVVGKSGIPEWRPALELLKHHPLYRERWHEHKVVEVSGQVGLSVEREYVRSLPPGELLELCSPEMRALVEPQD